MAQPVAAISGARRTGWTEMSQQGSEDRGRVGGVVPLLLYALIIAGWAFHAVAIGAWNLLPLVVWTLPVFALYVRRLKGRRHGF